MSLPQSHIRTTFDNYHLVTALFILDGTPPDFSSAPLHSVAILTDSINELVITTDISSPIPTGKMTVTDRSALLSSFVNKTNVYCSITFYREDFGVAGGTPVINPNEEFTHIFMVDQCNLLSHNLDNDVFELKLTSVNYLLLSQNIEYATKNTTVMKVLVDLISAAGLESFYPSEINPKIIFSKEIDVIPTVDDTVLTQLSKAIGDGFDLDDGPMFVSYDLIRDKVLINSKEMFEQTHNMTDNARNSVGSIGYLSTAAHVPIERAMISSLSIKNFDSINQMKYNTRPMENVKFDFDKGFWITNSLTPSNIYNKIANVERTGQNQGDIVNKVSEWIPKGLSKDELKYKSVTVRAKDDFDELLFEYVTKWFLHCNVISLTTTEGWIQRTPGDPYVIVAPTDNAINLLSAKMVLGNWTMIRVTHKILPGEAKYTNELLLARNETINTIDAFK